METFKNCLQSLKQSKSDNERLAALMVISKLTQPTSKDEHSASLKPLELNKELAERLYSSLSGTFLVRLLKSSERQDENAVLFHQLALSVLTVVARFDCESISKDDLVVEKLVSLLYESTRVDEKQSILYLFTVLVSKSVLVLLLKDPAQLIETTIKLLAETETANSCEILLSSMMSVDAWTDLIASTLSNHSEILLNNQELEKFKELETIERLTTLLRQSKTKSFQLCGETKTQLLKNVGLAVQDLLKSRVKSEYKCLAISLVANLMHQFGLDWIFKVNGGESSKFCVLVLACVSVELAWILNSENVSKEDLLAKKRFVIACFDITKTVLVHICTDEFEDNPLSTNSGFIVSLFNTFKNIIDTVYSFIQTFDSEDACLDEPLLIEALVLACVWATEETESLQDELKTTIPTLVKVGRHLLDEQDNDTVFALFSSMLPCIAQLLPDKELRKVLVEVEFVDMLQQFGLQVQIEEKYNQLLECLIHIIHEAIILIPTHCRSVSWKPSLIAKIVRLYRQSSENKGMFTLYSRFEVVVVLLRLTVLCGLKLPDDEFLQSVTRFLSETVEDIEDLDENYSDMWFIAVQSLIELVGNDDYERNKLKGSFDVKRALSQASESTVSKNAKSLIADFQRMLFT